MLFFCSLVFVTGGQIQSGGPVEGPLTDPKFYLFFLLLFVIGIVFHLKEKKVK